MPTSILLIYITYNFYRAINDTNLHGFVFFSVNLCPITDFFFCLSFFKKLNATKYLLT